MESFDHIFTWLTQHETTLSATAAIVVIAGMLLSPVGAGYATCFLEMAIQKTTTLPSQTLNQ
ncbi:MAG: hypothetical protein KBT89_05055 [Gammaproteobacteria bacterium]|nr:hypothetical protein [Gammaproteobacteria bacterium]